MCVDLPLFHGLMTFDSFCILGVEVVVGHEYRVGVSPDGLESKLTNHYQAQLQPPQRGVVRRYSLVHVLDEGRLNGHIRLEASPSEAAQVLAIGYGAFSKDADWTPVQVRLLDEPLPLHHLVDGSVEPLFAGRTINVERVQAFAVEVTDG